MIALSQVKSLTGRSFDSANKIWRAPNTAENLAKLGSFGFVIDGGTPEEPKAPVVIKRLPEPQAEIDERRLPSILRPYQIQAVKFLEWTNWKGLLALSPRLGKSACALMGTVLHPEFTPTLIMCPASAKVVWERQIEEWVGKKCIILQGITPYEIPSKFQFIVINYDILTYWTDYLLTLSIQYIIADESHRLGSSTIFQKKKGEEKGSHIPVKCTEAYTRLASKCHHIVLLSGTPITTAPKQLASQLAPIDAANFSPAHKFYHRFCDPKMGMYGWEYKGVSNLQELTNILSRIMFRRTKTDVFTELPIEDHQMLEIQIDEKLYEREMVEFRKWYKSNSKATEEEITEKLEHFESLSYAAKRSQILEWIRDFLESGEKLIVYTWHRMTTEDIHKAFPKTSVMMYGGTSMPKRQKAIDAFNTAPKINLFCGNIRACKEAISLYGASTIMYAELPQTSGDMAQANERNWLPHLKQDRLAYVYAVGKGTVDIKRVKVLKERAKLLSSVLDKDGSDVVLFGERLLEEGL